MKSGFIGSAAFQFWPSPFHDRSRQAPPTLRTTQWAAQRRSCMVNGLCIRMREDLDGRSINDCRYLDEK